MRSDNPGGGPELPRVDLVMPVHNEGATIEATLMEWQAATQGWLQIRFIIEEDGSTDSTKQILRALSNKLNMLLELHDRRRGYGEAMLSGLRKAATEWVATCDSDGQMDPADFRRLWEMRHNYDLVSGWRITRNDTWMRKCMSGAFRWLHRLLFQVRLHDPSSNLCLIRRSALERVLPRMGEMSEGFWWELMAYLSRDGARIGEAPVGHRRRKGGSTRVYRLTRIPAIAWRNGSAMLRIWWRK